MSTSDNWLLWQLVDSAFPTGGFAHSGGVEAAWQHGFIRDGDDLLELAQAALQQAAEGSVPVVITTVRQPADFAELDAFYDASVTNHVANRASRAQGRALLATASATFESERLTEALSRVRQEKLAGHLPIAFGLAAAMLELDDRTAGSSFLFMTARALLSSAVRLGIVGPLEGQQLQARLAASSAPLIESALITPYSNITQTAPMLDLLQSSQDRLYSRLFQS